MSSGLRSERGSLSVALTHRPGAFTAAAPKTKLVGGLTSVPGDSCDLCQVPCLPKAEAASRPPQGMCSWELVPPLALAAFPGPLPSQKGPGPACLPHPLCAASVDTR